eukprot:768656-Hanusia_phi.AAC.5
MAATKNGFLESSTALPLWRCPHKVCSSYSAHPALLLPHLYYSSTPTPLFLVLIFLPTLNPTIISLSSRFLSLTSKLPTPCVSSPQSRSPPSSPIPHPVPSLRHSFPTTLHHVFS